MDEQDLVKAVEWKIFELQSYLVDNGDESLIEESLKWFHPRHYEDVFEERANDKVCSNLYCLNTIKNDKRSFLEYTLAFTYLQNTKQTSNSY